MRKFDYSFLNNGLLPANLVNLTSNIAALKTMAGVRKDEYTQIFTELEAVAKVQSIKSSNAIEGIVTSDERIAAIVNQNSAPLNHNEAEIAGYRDALNEIHLGYEHIDFRQSDILRLHEMMMSFAGYEYGGQYKTDDNVILEIDTVGNRRVRFRPYARKRNPESNGAVGTCLSGCQKRCEYQPASFDSLRDSGLSLHPPVPGRKRQNVPFALAAAVI